MEERKLEINNGDKMMLHLCSYCHVCIGYGFSGYNDDDKKAGRTLAALSTKPTMEGGLCNYLHHKTLTGF
jgi:hypothetical protein